MAERNWTLDEIRQVINGGQLESLTAADFVKMNDALYADDVPDASVEFERSYVSEAAEKYIEDLVDKNFDDTTAEDLDSFVALLDRFSSKDNDGYKGKAAEVMKKVEDRRGVLKKQQEEHDFLNKVENLTPAELWERRKKLQEENTPEALAENKALEAFIVSKAGQVAEGTVAIFNLEQAEAFEKLLEDVKEHPLNDKDAAQLEAVDKALARVKEQITDTKESYGQDEAPRSEDVVEQNLKTLSQMPLDEELFKRGEDGKYHYPEFEEIDNILKNLQVKGDLTMFGRKKIPQDTPDSDISLFKERIRLETDMALANKAPEEITKEAFASEYADRLNMGIFEVAFANDIVEGKVSKKDANKLVSQLSKSAKSGKQISVHQDVLVGWQAAHAASNESAVKGLKERGQEKAATSFWGRVKALHNKCQEKHPNIYNPVNGLLSSAGWGAAYGVGAALGPVGIAAVATASFGNSCWKFCKSYKKAKDQAAGKGKKLKFWEYVNKNKAQAVGVVLSWGAAVTGGLDMAGVFANSPNVLAGITQARMGAGIALWGSTAAKQTADAYRQGGWKAAAKTAVLSGGTFLGSMVVGRAVGSLAGEYYNNHFHPNEPEAAPSSDVAQNDETYSEKGFVGPEKPDPVKDWVDGLKAEGLFNHANNEAVSPAPVEPVQETVAPDVQLDSVVSEEAATIEPFGPSMDDVVREWTLEADDPSQPVISESEQPVVREPLHGEAVSLSDDDVNKALNALGEVSISSDINLDNVFERNVDSGRPLFIVKEHEFSENGDFIAKGVGYSDQSVEAVINSDGTFDKLVINGKECNPAQLDWMNSQGQEFEGRGLLKPAADLYQKWHDIDVANAENLANVDVVENADAAGGETPVTENANQAASGDEASLTASADANMAKNLDNYINSENDNGLAHITSAGTETFYVDSDGQPHFQIESDGSIRDMSYEEAQSFVKTMQERVDRPELVEALNKLYPDENSSGTPVTENANQAANGDGISPTENADEGKNPVTGENATPETGDSNPLIEIDEEAVQNFSPEEQQQVRNLLVAERRAAFDELKNDYGLEKAKNSSDETKTFYNQETKEFSLQLDQAVIGDNGVAHITSDGMEVFISDDKDNPRFQIKRDGTIRDMSYEEAQSFVRTMQERVKDLDSTELNEALNKLYPNGNEVPTHVGGNGGSDVVPETAFNSTEQTVVNTEGWRENNNGVRIDPNPDRPAILKLADETATLGWDDGAKLQVGEVVREPDAKGNMQVLGRDSDGNMFKLVKCDVGASIENGVVSKEDAYTLDLPSEHPLYDKLNMPKPSDQDWKAYNQQLEIFRFSHGLDNPSSPSTPEPMQGGTSIYDRLSGRHGFSSVDAIGEAFEGRFAEMDKMFEDRFNNLQQHASNRMENLSQLYQNRSEEMNAFFEATKDNPVAKYLAAQDEVQQYQQQVMGQASNAQEVQHEGGDIQKRISDVRARLHQGENEVTSSVKQTMLPHNMKNLQNEGRS